MIEETARKLNDMRLFEMLAKMREISESAQLNAIEPIELVTYMVDAEYDKRRKNRIDRLKKKAKIKLPSSCIQDIEYSTKRNIKKEKMYDIITGTFLEHKHNVMISGATGVGKTYLACALANLACVNGFTTRYFRVSKFLEYVATEQACGNYLKIIEQVGKVKLLVLDDLGPDVMTKNQRNIFFEIIEERHLNTSTIIASQLPIEQWYNVFEDESVADAICDRIFHNAHKITLKGDSMRK
jgi:DNA replication protein DnaC